MGPLRHAIKYIAVASIASTITSVGMSFVTAKAVQFAVGRAWAQCERRCVESGGHMRRGIFRAEQNERVPLVFRFLGVRNRAQMPDVHIDENGRLVPKPLPTEVFEQPTPARWREGDCR